MTELELSEGLKQGDNYARKELYEHFAGSMLSLPAKCSYSSLRA